MAAGHLQGQARHAGMRHQPAWLLGLIVLVMAAMGARLVWLQLAQGAENKLLADQNRIRLLPRHPMRGRLLDRNGQVLASNRLTYNLYIQPRLVDDAGWPLLRARIQPTARL